MQFARKAALAGLALCALGLGGPTAGAAQETVNSASISGRVLDPQGAVVPGAAVLARQLDTNVVAQAVTDQDGRFRFAYLRVGPYEVRIERRGFAPVIHAVTLTVGSAFDIPISLTVEGVNASVSVTANATVLDAARTQIAGTVSRVEAESLPLNGRQFLDLALLVPGVSPTNLASTQLFPETSAVPGVGLSIGSQRNLSNNFIVDGVSANDDAAALSGIPFGMDAVEQFQIVTSGGQAELGRALGGYVNVVTKSGTNTLQGDAYGYFKDTKFNAANALSHSKLPMQQQQYGASIGGPVRRDRTFYFANVEQRRLNQAGLVTITPSSVDAINNRLATSGYPGARISTGAYPNPVRSTNVLGKLDQQISGADQLSIRYAFYDVSSSNSRGAGALNAATSSAGLDNRDQSLSVSNTMSLSSRMVNETRAQYARGDLKAPPSDLVGPAVSIAGVASFGTLSGAPTGRLNSLYQFVDNVSFVTGAHALRTGLDVVVNDDTIMFPRSIRGAYAFSSLASFLSGTYNNTGFTQTFGDTEVHQRNPNLGVYAQDEWRATPSLTLNLGLRYDLQWIKTISTDTNNVSPRVGFAWSPLALRRTVIRGGTGLYFDRVPLRAVANAILSAGNSIDLANLRQVSVSLSPTQAGAPVFPGILGAPVPLVTLVNLTTMDHNMQNAYSRQASLEVEQQIGDSVTVSAGYQYVRGSNLIISVNQNVPTCAPAGTNNACRPNPAYANNSQYSPLAESNYHGLHLSFVQRPSAWGHYRVSYTLSKSMNNVGENFFSSPIDPSDISKDWGRSDDDQRHRLVVDGAVSTSMEPGGTIWQRVSRGFQISAMMQAYSALPFNITSGITTLQGTAGRPLVNGAFIVRNSGVGSSFFNLNARLSRTIRVRGGSQIEVLAEVFNLTNHVNALTRNTTFGAGPYPSSPLPTFNQVTAVGDPRTWQFAVRVRF